LRDETEWIETVHSGWNRLVGADSATIVDAWCTTQKLAEHPPLFGDGTAGVRIVQIIENIYQSKQLNGLSNGNEQRAARPVDLGARL
jgi:UDP-N-acetylglucosamine 2-epimerase